MRLLLVGIIAAAILFVAVAALGFVGPFVAVLGFVAALLVLLNPAGVGSRIRQSPGWWSIPGMRRASRRAAPFAAMLLLYSVPVPLGAFALVHGTSTATPTPSPSSPVANVGGGDTAAPSDTPAATVTVPATDVPALTPTATATEVPTPAPTAVPTPLPAPPRTAPPHTSPPHTPPPHTPPPPTNLCGAPSNPWGYNFCGAGTISSPPGSFCSYFNCIPSFWKSTNGYVEQCADGMYSHSGGRQGACSSHGGNQRPLNP